MTDVQKVILNHSSGKDFYGMPRYRCKDMELIIAWWKFSKKCVRSN